MRRGSTGSCRLPTLQQRAHHTFHRGIADDISRRRITRAARDLLTTGDTVLDIALRYGYASHEVFTRAFRRLWGEPPSHFRRHRSFSDLYPRPIITQGGTTMTTTRGFALRRHPDPTGHLCPHL